MMFPLVRDLAAPAALLRVPVTVTCRVLGFSTQAFYTWLANPVCQRDWDDAHLINAALDLHGDDPEFGYRLLTDELRLKGLTARQSTGQFRRLREKLCEHCHPGFGERRR